MSGAAEPVMRVALQAGYGPVTVLHDIRFELYAGQSLGFVGASGAGKSTLALALLGLLAWRGGWARGEVMLDGVNLLALKEKEARELRGRRIALVPQSPMSALNAAVSLRRHFEEAWRAHEARGKREAFEARVQVLLEQVQLPLEPAFLDRKPGAISVGQAQRVLIALALLHRPAVVLADEPTSALDPVTQTEILKLLATVCADTGAALLYISHDLISVLQRCDAIAVLEGGRIAEQVAVKDLANRAHGSALQAMLDALPVPVEVVLRYRSQAAFGAICEQAKATAPDGDGPTT